MNLIEQFKEKALSNVIGENYQAKLLYDKVVKLITERQDSFQLNDYYLYYVNNRIDSSKFSEFLNQLISKYG